MQASSSSNPDTRPLPKGWVQHFENSKQLWYYVQVTVMPPKVSFTHPADLLSPTSSSHSRQSSRSPPQSSISPAESSSPSKPGMTLAQRLYASSGNLNAKPMIESHSITNLSTAPELPGLSPSRTAITPSTSPSTGLTGPLAVRSVTPVEATLSPSQSSGFNHKLYSFASEPQLREGSTAKKHRSSRSSQDRSQQMAGLKIPAGGNASTTTTGPHRTPHLTTTARPPAELGEEGDTSVGSPSSTLQSISNLGSLSPPASSILFSDTPRLRSKPLLPSIAATPSIKSADQPLGSPVSEVSTISTITPSNAHKYPHLAGAHGQLYRGSLHHRPDPRKLLAALKIAIGKGGHAISEADLQAVAKAEPRANYQVIISALKHQQQLNSQIRLENPFQPPQATVNYQALIADIEALQLTAQEQIQRAAGEAQQAQQAHLMAMEALKKQKSALLEQQAYAQHQAHKTASSRLESLQQQQKLAAAKLQSQKRQQQTIEAHQLDMVLEIKLKQEQANEAYQLQLQDWQQQHPSGN